MYLEDRWFMMFRTVGRLCSFQENDALLLMFVNDIVIPRHANITTLVFQYIMGYSWHSCIYKLRSKMVFNNKLQSFMPL